MAGLNADPEALAGIRIKIARAQHHLQITKTEINAFLDRNPYSALVEPNTDGSKYFFKARVMERPPLHWGVLIGEAVHQLRSALDHAVYQLTLDWSHEHVEGTGFPIFSDEGGYHQRKRKTQEPARGGGLYQVRGTGPSVQAFIEGLQPYQSPTPEDTILASLQDLWNKDKHRGIHFLGALGIDTKVQVPEHRGEAHPIVCLGGYVEDEATLATVTFTEPNPGVKVGFEFNLAMSIADPGRPPGPVVPLDQMMAEVVRIANILMLFLGRQAGYSVHEATVPPESSDHRAPSP